MAVLAPQSFFPALATLNKSAVMLVATCLLCILRVLDISALEEIPFDIILFFASAISLPVALVIAPCLGVAPEVIFYTALVTAGMPFCC